MDGKKLRLFYIQHRRQQTKNKEVVKRAIKGMTEEIMLNYIDEVLAPNTVPGQYLLMDQLSSHKTARVVPSLNQLPVESSIFRQSIIYKFAALPAGSYGMGRDLRIGLKGC